MNDSVSQAVSGKSRDFQSQLVASQVAASLVGRRRCVRVQHGTWWWHLGRHHTVGIAPFRGHGECCSEFTPIFPYYRKQYYYPDRFSLFSILHIHSSNFSCFPSTTAILASNCACLLSTVAILARKVSSSLTGNALLECEDLRSTALRMCGGIGTSTTKPAKC